MWTSLLTEQVSLTLKVVMCMVCFGLMSSCLIICALWHLGFPFGFTVRIRLSLMILTAVERVLNISICRLKVWSLKLSAVTLLVCIRTCIGCRKLWRVTCNVVILICLKFGAGAGALVWMVFGRFVSYNRLMTSLI